MTRIVVEGLGDCWSFSRDGHVHTGYPDALQAFAAAMRHDGTDCVDADDVKEALHAIRRAGLRLVKMVTVTP